jgi:hypothetical protein
MVAWPNALSCGEMCKMPVAKSDGDGVSSGGLTLLLAPQNVSSPYDAAQCTSKNVM